MRRHKISDKQIEEALRATGGFVTKAAKELGVTFQCLYRRINESEKLQEALKEIRETWIEIAEDQLLKKIREGDSAAIFFFLKCQAKHKGYVERQEVSGVEGKPVAIMIKNA